MQNALGDWPGPRPKVVTLEPNSLTDVWSDIQHVADALGVAERGRELVHALQARMAMIAAKADALPRKTVACIEWIEPLMAAGNWVPELVAMAGGVNLFGAVGKHSPWMTLEQLADRDPDVIVVMPCGFDLRRTREEMAALRGNAQWQQLRAVSGGEVFLTDGNQYFNRPGPARGRVAGDSRRGAAPEDVPVRSRRKRLGTLAPVRLSLHEPDAQARDPSLACSAKP